MKQMRNSYALDFALAILFFLGCVSLASVVVFGGIIIFKLIGLVFFGVG